MANMGEITVRTSEYRPCFVDGKKALFHRWLEYAMVIEPSPMVGGHRGGEIKYTLAIVEYEDGTLDQVNPSRVRFVPGIMNDYDFGGVES